MGSFTRKVLRNKMRKIYGNTGLRSAWRRYQCKQYGDEGILLVHMLKRRVTNAIRIHIKNKKKPALLIRWIRKAGLAV